jgi:hypothetical protein
MNPVRKLAGATESSFVKRRTVNMGDFRVRSIRITNIYPAPQDIVLTSMLHGVAGDLWTVGLSGAIQDPGYRFPRTCLLETVWKVRINSALVYYE